MAEHNQTSAEPNVHIGSEESNEAKVVPNSTSKDHRESQADSVETKPEKKAVDEKAVKVESTNTTKETEKGKTESDKTDTADSIGDEQKAKQTATASAESAGNANEQSIDTNAAKNAVETIEQKVKQTKEELEQRVKQAKDELEQKMKTSFKFYGVEFAPVMLPIERRLQTLVVLLSFWFTTVGPISLILLMILLLFTPLFFLPVLYGTWMFLDRKTPHRGGRRSEFMRRLPIWRYFRDYFPISMTKTADLDPSRNYLIGYHPHGILAFGAMMNFGSESTGFSKAYPGIKPYILTLNTQFRWPIVRAYLMSFGVCAVSRESIKYILTSAKGHAAIIVVGGAEEALEARPGSFTVLLRKRKGFIRQAIQNGADLVPSYSFGENDLFKQLENTPGSKVRAFQEWFKRTMSFSPPIIYGRGVFNYSFGLMPYRRPIDTVIGKPIRVERDENPTEEVIDHYHRLYMDSLYELFEEHKGRHGISDDSHINFI